MSPKDRMPDDGYGGEADEFGRRRPQDPAAAASPKVGPYAPVPDPITAEGGDRVIPYSVDLPPVASIPLEEDDYDRDLVVWLREQLDDDEEVLQGSGDLGWITFREPNGEMRYTSAASSGPDDLWFVDGRERTDYAAAAVVHRESERLADIAAKRKLIDELIRFMEGDYAPWNETYLQLLALPYADRPCYQEKWRPEAVAE